MFLHCRNWTLGVLRSYETWRCRQAVIPILYAFYAFYDIAFTPPLGSYEIWQYTLPARGVALVHFATQVAVFFNIFVNPIALAAIA